MADYTIEERKLIWNKGRIINTFDPNIWRHDAYGFVIHWEKYGTTDKYGWEVDHITPKAKVGSDDYQTYNLCIGNKTEKRQTTDENNKSISNGKPPWLNQSLSNTKQVA